MEAMLMGLDAEKAFDSVRWSFIYKVLNKFGFNHTVFNTIQSIYNNTTAKIKINGSLSKPFTLERSCHQGCPLSPTLLTLFIEPFSQYIRQGNQIKGIKIRETIISCPCLLTIF